jgi:hypothetical protein
MMEASDSYQELFVDSESLTDETGVDVHRLPEETWTRLKSNWGGSVSWHFLPLRKNLAPIHAVTPRLTMSDLDSAQSSISFAYTSHMRTWG